MRYGFILLDNFLGINSFKKTENLSIIKGNPITLYFMLVTIHDDSGDVNKDTLRYIPPSPIQTYVSFYNIDDNQSIEDRPASQPFPSQDASIFSVTIASDENISANSMSVKFNDGTNTFYAIRLSNLSQKAIGSNEGFFC